MGLSLNLSNDDVKLQSYNYLVTFTGISVFAFCLTRVSIDGWKEITAFILVYFLSQLLPARLPQGDVFSVSVFLDMTLIALFGTPLAVTVSFGATILTRFCGNLFRHHEPVRDILKGASNNVLVIAAAGVSYSLFNNSLIAFVVSSLVYFLMSVFFLSASSVIFSKSTSKVGWFSLIKMLLINYLVLAIMAFTMILVYTGTTSEWRLFVILLFFVPILLVSHSFRLFTDIKHSYLNTVKTVAAAIEANDSYTKGHSERVAELALALGKALGIRDSELQKLQYIALLHDVGKIGISDVIVNKPGALSKEEYEKIKEHSAIGAEILKKIKFLSNKSDIILHHHERYDGSGYPAGLKGTDIPVESRILAIADAYDAMTTDRPYRQGITPGEAVGELNRCSGIQFDPELVEKFKVVLRKIGEI